MRRRGRRVWPQSRRHHARLRKARAPEDNFDCQRASGRPPFRSLHWNNLALTFHQINRTCSRGVDEDTMPVADWLRSLNLSDADVTDYEKKFSDKGITDEQLLPNMGLVPQDLYDIGIKLIHRQQLLDAISAIPGAARTASPRAEARRDLIRRLFPVAISVGFAARLIHMKWLENGKLPNYTESEELAVHGYVPRSQRMGIVSPRRRPVSTREILSIYHRRHDQGAYDHIFILVCECGLMVCFVSHDILSIRCVERLFDPRVSRLL